MSKKNIIGLSTLLLVLLLGLFTTSYATITESDIKNLIWAKAKNKALSDYQAQTICDKIDFTHIPKNTNANTTYSDITTYLNNENYSMVAKNEGNYVIIFICDNRLSKRLTCANDKSYLTCYYVGRFETTTIDQYNWNTTKFWGSMTSGNYGWAGTTSPQYYSPELPAISNINNSTSVIISAPHSNPSWFKSDGPYSDWDPIWEFNPISGDYIYVPYDTGNSKCYTIFKRYNYLEIGNWCNTLYADSLYLAIDAYNYNTGKFETLSGPDKIWSSNYGYINEYYSTDFTNDGETDIWNTLITYKSKNVGNNFVLHFVGFADNTSYEDFLQPYDLPKSVDIHIYIKDSHTSVSGDILNLDNTFTNDYRDDYINQIDNVMNNIEDNINNQQIIGAIDSINNNITDTNISSGDELELEDLPSIVIESGDDPSEDFFIWLGDEFVTILTDTTNVNLTIPLFGRNYVVASNYFVLENGLLRTFLGAGWWFIVGVPFLKYIRSSIEKLKGGNIPNSGEKEDLLNHII